LPGSRQAGAAAHAGGAPRDTDSGIHGQGLSPVSGVVLFARNSKAAGRLAEQFQLRQVTKVYWGVVEGDVQPDEDIWTDWLRKIKEESRSEQCAECAEGARQAVLRYRRLRPCAGGCLVEFIPETGRMHQIRLQASLRGHPIRGDAHYGAILGFGPAAPLPRDRMIALHARSLTFLHPLRYEPITVTAPLPAVWNELGLEMIGLD
jgi:23S rRNA pseudouridine1911/1915/1917 synthase